MKSYSDAQFEHFILLIRKDDDMDREWLLNNSCRELVEFFDAIDGMENAFRWLLENNYRQLAATVDAINGNAKAKVFLLQSGNRELAAFVEATTGSQNAVSWLLKFNHKGWVLAAKEFYDKQHKKEKRGFLGLFDFGNPYA
ncbi:MAG: hypothetical protein IPP51_13495 [Bacteroidetes bacterium]|nr:hypothetical protein [Bacteroidota bacterium]